MPRRRLLVIAALAVLLALGVVFVRNFTDFAVYYAAGKSLLAGRTDLYSPDFARGVVMDYRYLPAFILAFSPLSLAPYPVAAWLWHLLDTLAIVVSVASIARLYEADAYPRRDVWGVAFLAVVPYYVMALDYGNAHLIVTAMMFAAFSLALDRRDVPAAMLLAAVITVKIVPALTLAYFAIKGRFRLLGLVLAFILALNLLPSAYFGMAGNRALLMRWYQHVIAGQEFHEINGPINLSLKGQLQRTLTDVDYTRRVDGDHDYAAVNLMSMPATTIERVWLALSACALIAGAALIWHGTRGRGTWRSLDAGERRDDVLQIGLLISLMLFVGPLTSRLYLVALLWPVVAVAIAIWDRRPLRHALVAAAVLSAFLPLLPGRTIQRWLLVAGVDFYLLCVILALTAITLVRRHQPRARGAPYATEAG